jgi:hypothetical protein
MSKPEKETRNRDRLRAAFNAGWAASHASDELERFIGDHSLFRDDPLIRAARREHRDKQFTKYMKGSCTKRNRAASRRT